MFLAICWPLSGPRNDSAEKPSSMYGILPVRLLSSNTAVNLLKLSSLRRQKERTEEDPKDSQCPPDENILKKYVLPYEIRDEIGEKPLRGEEDSDDDEDKLAQLQ